MGNVCATNSRQEWAGCSNVLGRLGVKKTAPRTAQTVPRPAHSITTKQLEQTI